MNGIQEVSGSIPLGSTKFQDNIRYLLVIIATGASLAQKSGLSAVGTSASLL